MDGKSLNSTPWQVFVKKIQSYFKRIGLEKKRKQAIPLGTILQSLKLLTRKTLEGCSFRARNLAKSLERW